MMQDLSESRCFTERAKIRFVVGHSLAPANKQTVGFVSRDA
jgi:hypothetical protein